MRWEDAFTERQGLTAAVRFPGTFYCRPTDRKIARQTSTRL
jgi:hypothetical protein